MDFDTMILCYDCGCRLREDHVGDLCPACAARYGPDGYVIQSKPGDSYACTGSTCYDAATPHTHRYAPIPEAK